MTLNRDQEHKSNLTVLKKKKKNSATQKRREDK